MLWSPASAARVPMPAPPTSPSSPSGRWSACRARPATTKGSPYRMDGEVTGGSNAEAAGGSNGEPARARSRVSRVLGAVLVFGLLVMVSGLIVASIPVTVQGAALTAIGAAGLVF